MSEPNQDSTLPFDGEADEFVTKSIEASHDNDLRRLIVTIAERDDELQILMGVPQDVPASSVEETVKMACRHEFGLSQKSGFVTNFRDQKKIAAQRDAKPVPVKMGDHEIYQSFEVFIREPHKHAYSVEQLEDSFLTTLKRQMDFEGA